MSKMNRLSNAKNEYQGKHKRVLCVCSAGLLRSPTAALVLSQPPFNYNTRASGLDADFALIPVDDVLLHWADEVVCMSKEQEHRIKKDLNYEGQLVCLDIPDSFEYRDPKLIKMIAERYKKLCPEPKR